MEDYQGGGAGGKGGKWDDGDGVIKKIFFKKLGSVILE